MALGELAKSYLRRKEFEARILANAVGKMLFGDSAGKSQTANGLSSGAGRVVSAEEMFTIMGVEPQFRRDW